MEWAEKSCSWCPLYKVWKYIYLLLCWVENKLRYAYMNNHNSFTEEYFTLKAFKWGWQPVYELPPVVYELNALV